MNPHTLEIPRSTCRLFGTIKALSTVKKSAILVHGPKGCVYHINYIMGMRGDRPISIYTTSLDEQDVIFGAEGKLTSAIEELDRRLSPDLIFVLSCCATSIIGEDVESACRAAQARARVIGFQSGGFEGDHHTAYGETLCRLAEELPGPRARPRPSSVNLIGMLRGGPDLRELKRVLSLAGIEVRSVLSADATLRDLERLGEAALNIVVCEPAGRAPAELLEKKYGTPFIVEDLPIRGPCRRTISGARGHGTRDPVLAGMPCRGVRGSGSSRGRGEGGMPVSGGHSPGREPTGSTGQLPSGWPWSAGPPGPSPCAGFSGTQAWNPSSWSWTLRGEPGRSSLASASRISRILIEPSQEEILSRLSALGVDLIIGGMAERPLATMLGIPCIDMMHGSQRTACFTGEKELSRMIAEVQASRSRGRQPGGQSQKS